MTFLVFACEDTDTTIQTQQNSIMNYIRAQGYEPYDPVSNYANYYDSINENLYRTVRRGESPNRNDHQLVGGDSIDIWFTGYVFASSPSTIFYTNIPYIQDELSEADSLFVNDYWDNDTWKVELGRTKLINGLTTALIGTHERDTVEVYLTGKEAYGNHQMGQVPQNSAIMFEVVIDSLRTR